MDGRAQDNALKVTEVILIRYHLPVSSGLHQGENDLSWSGSPQSIPFYIIQKH